MDPHYSFLLFKPDCIIRNLIDDICAELELMNFNLIDFRIGKVTYELYRTMYSPNFKWEFDYWSHNYSAFRFSPVISLLLKGLTPPLPFSSNQEYLHSIKGHAVPRFSENKTLRKKFNAYSRVLNLIHIPDNSKKADTEALKWFELEVQGKESPINYIDFKQIKNEVEKHGYSTDKLLDGKLTFEYIKYRLFYSVSKLSNSPAEQLKKVEYNILKTISFLKRVKINDPERMTFLNKSYLNESKLLSSIKSMDLSSYKKEFIDYIRDLLMILENINNKNYSQQIENYFWALADKFMVFYSELEKFLISTTFKYAE